MASLSVKSHTLLRIQDMWRQFSLHSQLAMEATGTRNREISILKTRQLLGRHETQAGRVGIGKKTAFLGRILYVRSGNVHVTAVVAHFKSFAHHAVTQAVLCFACALCRSAQRCTLHTPRQCLGFTILLHHPLVAECCHPIPEQLV